MFQTARSFESVYARDAVFKKVWQALIVARHGTRPHPGSGCSATQYQALAEVMTDAAKAGVTKIGFVSDPSNMHQ